MYLPAGDRKLQFTQLKMCVIDLSNASNQASMKLHVPEHFRNLILLTINKAEEGQTSPVSARVTNMLNVTDPRRSTEQLQHGLSVKEAYK